MFEENLHLNKGVLMNQLVICFKGRKAYNRYFKIRTFFWGKIEIFFDNKSGTKWSKRILTWASLSVNLTFPTSDRF